MGDYIGNLTLKFHISSNFKTAHFSIWTRKYLRTSTILIRNLHNPYEYNNLPLKPKSNFLCGEILQITPNSGYYPKRDSIYLNVTWKSVWCSCERLKNRLIILRLFCFKLLLIDSRVNQQRPPLTEGGLPVVQSTRSQEQKLPIERPLLWGLRVFQ